MEKSRVFDRANYRHDPQEHSDQTEAAGGTEHDRLDMERLGQKQQLKRNFSWLSILALNVVVCGTWFTWLTTLPFVFLNGGRGAATWTYLVSWAFTITTILSLAEMASMAPVAGGQYHWVSVFGPPRFQKVLSYVTGWLSILGWQTFVATAAYAAGNLILILASTMNPQYVPANWHATLMTLLIAFLSLAFNIFAVRSLPLFERCMFVFFFGSLFAILVPLWILAPKASSKAVWTDFGSLSGWTNLGLACAIGQISSGGSMIGTDAAVHMAEEVRNASLVVPWTIVGTNVIGVAFGLALCLTINYSIQDIGLQIAESASVYPFIGIFQDAVGSTGGAVGMTVGVVVLSFAAAVNSIAAASRETFAFGRDGGLPFSNLWARVWTIRGHPVPLPAAVLTIWFTIFSALLNLAGSEVYDAIISLAAGAVCGSYIISIGSLLVSRLQGRHLPPRRFSLGSAGLYANAIAFLYNIQLVVFSYFPLFSPVTGANMNYGPVVFVGVVLLAALNYLFQARKYTPPVVHFRLE